MNIIDKLNELDNLMAKGELLRIERNAAIDSVYTPELRAQVQNINTEFDIQAKTLNEMVEKLTAEVKAEVLVHGSTVKASHLMAVWNKGRVSWDSKLLDGLAIAYPPLLAARKEGEPTITIRKV